ARQRLRTPNQGRTSAPGARTRAQHRRSPAGGTRRAGDEPPVHRARVAPPRTGAAAGAPGRRLRPRLGARATTRPAAVEGTHAHGLRGPGGDLGQGELEGHLQVRATVPVASALAAAEDRIEPAQVPEVAHEDVERLGQVEMREAEPASRAPSTP